MKKLYLIKNPEIFQGKKYLNNKKNYFEGWYFKNTSSNNSISFIPGVNINENQKKAFIQIITDKSSYFINYNIEDFKYNHQPFYIKIGNNYFSKDIIHIDIKDKRQKLIIYGDIKYSNSTNIKTNFFYPNIMGPFSYIPFMECNHAILSMKTRINGFINFDNGLGYIEKDWGCSFPKKYIWCQGNNFQNNDASFMLSIADIPFKAFHFKGFICSLIVNNKEYRFATYNNSKISKFDIGDKFIDIILKKGIYTLYIKSNFDSSFKLLAPIKGKMEKDIYESLSASINIKLKKKNKVIFNDTSINCGLEIVN